MTKKKKPEDVDITGRPTKYNQQRVESICKFIREGMAKAQAANLSGITECTLHQWAKDKPEFSEAIKDAEAEFEKQQILVIREASINRYDKDGRITRRGSWMASAWLLERKHHDRYGMRWAGELSGKGGKDLIPEAPPQVDTSRFTKEQLDKLILSTEALLKMPTPKVETNGHTNGGGTP